MTDVSVLKVLLHDQPIGALTYLGNERNIFTFTEDYIDNPERPTLSLGFNDQNGLLMTDFRVYQKRLMPFFSNLLPEGYLRHYLSARAGVNPEREFHLIYALGHDLPGALTIKPDDEETYRSVSKTVIFEEDEVQQENVMRFSLAGVQLKFSAVLDTSGGLTIPASGVGGAWIVKLPSHEFAGVPENEFSMMRLAQLIGMEVPPIDLVKVNNISNLPDGIDQFGKYAFVIKRFDRKPDGGAIHIEDFAQVFGVYPEKKYDKASMRNILKVLAAEVKESDIVEFVRRLVFNILIGNGDMHLKNWSLIYHDRRNASLAPAYDFVSTIPYISHDQMALKISRTKEFAGMTKDELTHLAEKTAVPQKLVLDTAHETVALFHQHWEAEKHHLPMSNHVRQAIDHHLTTLPMMK